MVSQADRELISNFVSELSPYLDSVESGARELVKPSPDGVIIGQAIQAMGMVRGAGSMLQISDLVTIADLLARAFEMLQSGSRLSPPEAGQRMNGLASALRDFLVALDAGEETGPFVTRARTIFESIPSTTSPSLAEFSISNPRDLDAMFSTNTGQTGSLTARGEALESDGVVGAEPSLEQSRRFDEEDTQRLPIIGNSEQAERATDGPVSGEPDVAAEASAAPPNDHELMDIFVEEAAGLVNSFGEMARTIARAPDDFTQIERLRRDAHTIKGAANMTGFQLIGQVGGAVERVLDTHIDYRAPVTRETLELLLVSWKMLRAMMMKLDDLSMFTAPVTSVERRSETLRDQIANQFGPEIEDVVTGEEPEPAGSANPDVVAEDHTPALPEVSALAEGSDLEAERDVPQDGEPGDETDDVVVSEAPGTGAVRDDSPANAGARAVEDDSLRRGDAEEQPEQATDMETPPAGTSGLTGPDSGPIWPDLTHDEDQAARTETVADAGTSRSWPDLADVAIEPCPITGSAADRQAGASDLDLTETPADAHAADSRVGVPDWHDQVAGDTDDAATTEPVFEGYPVVDEVQPGEVREWRPGRTELPLEEQSLGGDEISSALLNLAFSVNTEERAPASDGMPDDGISVFDETREAEIAAEMFETFAIECPEHLEALSRAAMQLDRDPAAPGPMREVKHTLHTLKGAAAAADVRSISDRSHSLEDHIATIEQTGRTADAALVADVFAAIDDIERLLVARREEIRDAGVDAVLPDNGSEQTSLRVDLARIDGLLNTVGELVVNRAGLEQHLANLSETLDELSLSTARLLRSNQALERGPHAGYAEQYRTGTETRWLRTSRPGGPSRMSGWDDLEFDRYTEFDRLIRQLAEVGADVDTAVREIGQLRGDLDTVAARQRRLTTSLQDEMMDIRMMPISSLAPRLYRVIRRVAGSRDKEARLVLEGGDTLFDKTLLDALDEPLLHLLRNAVDHGIETPAERTRSGKPEAGTIRVRAYRDGSEAVIDIVDDGAGIDHQRVADRARQYGHDIPDGLSRSDILRLLFLPGFSTRDTADDISGRGVGLDIVEDTVLRYKGRLSIDSTPGKGTIVSLRLPVMLAVTQAFLVTAGGADYAVPISNIEFVANRQDQPLTRVGDALFLETADAAVPVIDLGARFGRAELPLAERDSGWMLVADIGGERRALCVDELEGQREIVVKPLGRFLRTTPGLLGATIRGNGDVALIIDVPRLLGIDTSMDQVSFERWDESAAAPPDRRDSVGEPRAALIVDDSLSVRRVVGRTLERHGWSAILARDGVEALELLDGATIDIVITDIEMPRMDGYELLSTVRSRAAIAETPVIILTSRSGEKHRSRAFELGAAAYLVKPYQEQDLLDTIEQSARALAPA